MSQKLMQCSGPTTHDGQVFGIRVTDAPDVPSIVTTPLPASLPLSFDSPGFTLPTRRSGVNFKETRGEGGLEGTMCAPRSSLATSPEAPCCMKRCITGDEQTMRIFGTGQALPLPSLIFPTVTPRLVGSRSPPIVHDRSSSLVPFPFCIIVPRIS